MTRLTTGAAPTRRRARRTAIAALVVLTACGTGMLPASSSAAQESHAAHVSAAAGAENPIVSINDSDAPEQIREKAAKVTPTARQLAWQQEELTGFVHFGPNTFSGREWGSGAEDPDVFNPSSLDTDQWARTFKDAGFKKVILTAKHHDGMLLFPSAYSSHGVASSSWRNGQGDVLKEFTDSARKVGLKVGVYLSPADGSELPHQWWKEKWVPGIVKKHDAGQSLTTIEQSTYDDRDRTPGGQGRYGNGSEKKTVTIPSNGGDGPKFTVEADDYNTYYMNTLYEVLTKYGKFDEVWLDGANPWKDAGLNQSYNFTDWYKMIRMLQPSAGVFGGPDIRWVGNEDGLTTRTNEWSVVPQKGAAEPDGERTPTYGFQGDDIASDDKLTTDSDYLAWHPAECDGRLQGPNWFWNKDAQPISLDALKNMYRNSVGKNCQLLLNVAPDNNGRVAGPEEARMREFGGWIRSTFDTDHAEGATAADDAGTSHTPGNDPGNVLDDTDDTAWQPTGTSGNLVLDLGSDKTFNTVNVKENIQVGQRTTGFAVDVWDGQSWKEAGKATTIGYRRILKLSESVTTSKVRLRITSSRALPPAIATVSLHNDQS
ncbi:alpha-L-fucosidase [Streptomyces sp. NPDC059037]|uniref:alpha-L-fucosidase n=1 Tax=Streptomyces sp. NPDC059037 TaxID=3346710 RepID=UPI00368672E2